MKYNLLLIFIVTLFISSCKEDFPIEEMEVLNLILPAVDSETSHCCILFEWEASYEESSFNFILAYDESFNDVLVDTIISTDSFYVADYLPPSNSYFWKVSSTTSDLSSIANFQTINYGNFYQGQHIATKTQKSVQGGYGVVFDTSYTTMVDISSTLDGQVDIDGSIMSFLPSYSQDIIRMNKPSDFPHEHEDAQFILSNDSLFYSWSHTPNGNQHYNRIYAKLK